MDIISMLVVTRMAQRMHENNTWYRYDEDSNICVVFVHGFFSSSSSCWTNKENDIFWPELLVNDGRLPKMSIYLAGYYTNVDSGQYGIRECAEEVFDALRRFSVDGHEPPIRTKNLVFICHSLGGIVTRYMLEAKREFFTDHKLGLVLFASPSVGSDYANSLSKIASFYSNRIGKQLGLNSEMLSDLDGRFKNFVDGRDANSFSGVEAVEHVGFFHMRWLPGFEPVVLKNSASRYFSDSRTLPATDHSSIVKPSSPSHVSHAFLVDFFSNLFLQGHPISFESTNPNLKRLDSLKFHYAALFDIYDAECEPYYLERRIDTQIAADFSVASFWVFGPSGCGKTSIIKRLLSLKNIKAVEMCFSQCPINSPRDSFIAEIFETLHIQVRGYADMPQRSFRGLIRLISDILDEKKSLFIYIDEIPVPPLGLDNVEDELMLLIEDILTSVKQVSDANEFRIIISSLSRPNLSLGKNVAKLNGYLRICECSAWPEQELERLVSLITPNIAGLKIQDLPNSLVSRSHGSPRFLKTFFKNKVAHPDKDNEEILVISEYGFLS